MPELEKIGKVLDSKIKGLTESGKKIFSDGSVSQQSVLEQLTLERDILLTELGIAVYENRKAEEQSEYEEFFEKIKDKQQLIDAETNKLQGKICQKCGSLLTREALFCPKCGEKVVEQDHESTKQCPSCGAQLRESAKFCVNCGANCS